ncbi:ankyrin [Cadophora sp. DSE1049]|nr:ankyrin [Cadophora sp. DSE1049]
MSLPTLPNELLLQIASLLPTPSLSTLLQTNTHLATLLTPLLYHPELTLHPKSNPKAAINWAAHRLPPRCLTLMHLWSSKTLLAYLRTLPLSTIERVDSDGRTLLHHAIDQNNTKVVEILMEKDMDVNREDKLERSYLSYAIRTLNVTVSQKLIETGAEIENSRYEDIPLACFAVSYGNFPLAQCVISGLQSQKEKSGETLFSPQSKSNPSHNILHYAVFANNESTISLLLSLGAPTSTLDHKGHTPLMLAIQSGSDSITNLLLDSIPACGILAKNKDSETALHFLSHHTPYLSASTIQRLLDLTLSSGGNISHPRLSDHSTPLHLSATHSSPLTTQLLLSAGANYLAADNQGLTPLLSAIETNTPASHGQHLQNRVLTINLLITSMSRAGDTFLSRGDSLNLRICQGTALHFAARSGNLRVVKDLIEVGADVLAGDAAGRTALECALPVCNSRMPLKIQIEREGRIGERGRGREKGREGCEETCLVLARAMWERGFGFGEGLRGIKGYKARETTWLELVGLVEMERLGAFIRGCIDEKERN